MARIDYVELPSVTAHEVTRGFYSKAFGWKFTDYGPDYAATTTGDVDVGLNGQPGEALAAPLPVIRVDDLEAVFDSVSKSGGIIAKSRQACTASAVGGTMGRPSVQPFE